VQPRLGRPTRDVEQRRSLGLGEPLQLAQHQDGALLGGELPQRVRDLDPQLRGHAVGRLGDLLDRDQRAPRSGQPEGLAHRDPPHPTVERGRLP
jgi:hypothetical protein